MWYNLRDSIWTTMHSYYLSKEGGPRVISSKNGVVLEHQTLKKIMTLLILMLHCIDS